MAEARSAGRGMQLWPELFDVPYEQTQGGKS
jgi:hypothetical protein